MPAHRAVGCSSRDAELEGLRQSCSCWALEAAGRQQKVGRNLQVCSADPFSRAHREGAEAVDEPKG